MLNDCLAWPQRHHYCVVGLPGLTSCVVNLLTEHAAPRSHTTSALLQVSSVVAIGLVEGSSHVNWKLLCTTLLWWAVGFFVTIVVTALCVAQGQ